MFEKASKFVANNNNLMLLIYRSDNRGNSMAATEEPYKISATKNYERALTLGVDAPIEKIKELYSVWALTYDKVAIRACISEFSLQFSIL